MSVPALAYQQAIMPIDPGAIAAAEAVKARIQSAYIMAMQKPRNEMQSRSRILEACKRPEFASRVEYAKPVGGKKMTGPSIRFAELAVREWGNVITETQLVYEDDNVRRVKVTVIDLETNATFGKEIQIKKTVERKDGKGREIVGERMNTYNEKVFIVLATDEELHTKEAALISKVIRNEGLRLIPQDIIDEGIEVARKTLHNRDAQDPKAALKKVVDAFGNIGISPKQLEVYLGHALDIISPAEIHDLRGVYQAVSSGEASWAEYVAKPETKAPSNDVNDLLKPQAAKQAKAPAEPTQPEPMPAAEQPAEDQKRHRPTAAELEEMRADMVAEIESRGVALAEIEKMVGAYSNTWTPKDIEKIRGKILPNLLAELAGA